MAWRDLQEFLDVLRRERDLVEIREPVDRRLEVTEIADRVMKREKGGPALLFTSVKDSRIPILVNLFGSEKRMCRALERDSFAAAADEIRALVKPEIPTGLWDKLKQLPKLKMLADLAPRTVSGSGVPCQEIVATDGDLLSEIPLPTCWPQDGGPYVTLGVTFTRSPADGSRNAGLYRIQQFDGRTLGMHWQRHKGSAAHYRQAEALGKPLEVAVAIGPDPAVTYAASAPMPEGMDEMLLAGFFRRKGVDLVKCRTVDLEVPATSQIVLEGTCAPRERRREGPFGDHTGFYSLADDYPVLKLTAVTRRKDAILQHTIVGPPPMEDEWLGTATVRIFLPMIQQVLPEIVDMHLPVEACFHNLAIVAIDKQYPGHAQKVMHALWGFGQLMFSKVVVIVDKDVNVRDMREVVWKVGAALDPARDLLLSTGPTDVLDHAAARKDVGGKLGLDATRKWPEEYPRGAWPDEVKMDPEVKARVDRMWGRLGL